MSSGADDTGGDSGIVETRREWRLHRAEWKKKSGRMPSAASDHGSRRAAAVRGVDNADVEI